MQSRPFGILAGLLPRRGGNAEAPHSAEAEDNFAAWKPVVARRAGFRVEMPGKATEEAQWASSRPGAPNVHRFWSTAFGFTYSATCYDYTNATGGEVAARTAMGGERLEWINKELRLLREEAALLAGEPGYQYEFAYRNGTRCVRRSVRIGVRIFHLDVTFSARLADESVEHFPRFFRSLTLIPPAEAEEEE